MVFGNFVAKMEHKFHFKTTQKQVYVAKVRGMPAMRAPIFETTNIHCSFVQDAIGFIIKILY